MTVLENVRQIILKTTLIGPFHHNTGTTAMVFDLLTEYLYNTSRHTLQRELVIFCMLVMYCCVGLNVCIISVVSFF